MARQHLRFPWDGQLCQFTQTLSHLCTAAALQIGAADAACKQGVTAEEITAAQQHHAAGGVSGRVPCRKDQFIHRHGAVLGIAAVCRRKRIHAVTCKVRSLTVELCVPLGAQGFGTAHMVVMAVGAQDGGEPGMVLF